MSVQVVRLMRKDALGAASAGASRTIQAIYDAREREPGRVDLGFERDAIGALGECAFALWLGVPWAPETQRPDTQRGDVAGYQVRTTTRPGGRLIVRPTDPAAHAYVLAVLNREGGRIVARLPGWIAGAEACQPQFWRKRGSRPGIHQSAFFVPQAALHSLETLRDETSVVARAGVRGG